jgi:hypothetical protein
LVRERMRNVHENLVLSASENYHAPLWSQGSGQCTWGGVGVLCRCRRVDRMSGRSASFWTWSFEHFFAFRRVSARVSAGVNAPIYIIQRSVEHISSGQSTRRPGGTPHTTHTRKDRDREAGERPCSRCELQRRALHDTQHSAPLVHASRRTGEGRAHCALQHGPG